MIEPTTRRTVGPQLSASSRNLDFGGQLRRFAEILGKRINVVHKEISIKMFNQIVMATPVDTGEARGGWNASMSYPDLSETGRRDPTGAAALKDIESTIKADRSQIAFLSNSVGHIVPLEYGWSKQAPEGMVRITVTSFNTMIREVIQDAKRSTT
jgi:hypothetical protein